MFYLWRLRNFHDILTAVARQHEMGGRSELQTNCDQCVCVCVCACACTCMQILTFPHIFKKSKGWRKGAQFLAGTGLFPLSPHPDQLSGPPILQYDFKLNSRKSELCECIISLHIGYILHVCILTYVWLTKYVEFVSTVIYLVNYFQN